MLDKLLRINPASPDYSVSLNYAQTLLDLPWSEFTKDNLDIKKAKKILDGQYIELNEARDVKLIAVSIDFTKSTLDKAYTDGDLTDDEYDESLTAIDSQLEFAESSIAEKWEFIKENGISKSLFVGNLIYNLFFIAIYNAILALFIRRKNEIV